MKNLWLLSMALLAGCASTSTHRSVDAERCAKAVSQLQARHCDLSNDDKRKTASGMAKDYDAWDKFFRDLADTAVVCMWDQLQ